MISNGRVREQGGPRVEPDAPARSGTGAQKDRNDFERPCPKSLPDARIGLNPAGNQAIEIVNCPTSLARRAQWLKQASEA